MREPFVQQVLSSQFPEKQENLKPLSPVNEDYYNFDALIDLNKLRSRLG